MSNSYILSYLKKWINLLYGWFKSSRTLHFLHILGQGIVRSIRFSRICQRTVKIGKALSLEEAQNRSILLQFFNRIVCRFFDFLKTAYQKLAGMNQTSLNHAVFCQVLKPLDSIFNAFYALIMVGCGFLTVVLLKNLILLHFNLNLLIIAVGLVIFYMCAAMGGKLRQAVNHSFFVRFIGIFFD